MDQNSSPNKTINNQKKDDHSYDFIMDQSQQNQTPEQPKKKRLFVTISIIIVLLLLGGLLWLVVASDDAADQASEQTQGTTADQLTTQLEFEDPLFRMDVPGIWLVSEDYEPGVTPVFFSGPATHEIEEFNDSSETITMTVKEFASEVYPNEAVDSSDKVIEQDDYENNGVTYTYRVLENAVDGGNEDGPRRAVARNVARQGDRVLVAEVAVPAEAWNHYRELINQSMRSLEPR